ncbi:hypothetical protein YPPY14_0996, partial [Yersinia pestis PY-14]
MYVGDAQQLEL